MSRQPAGAATLRAADANIGRTRGDIAGVRYGDSIPSIAKRLARAPSTICREIKRNRGKEGYRASHADALAWDRAKGPKACKLVSSGC